MTNCIVSLVKDGVVRLKVVAGCDGYNGKELASKISLLAKPEEAYDLALNCGVGCADCLVVQHQTGNLYRGGETLGGLYCDRDKFADPKYSPRWPIGTCYHTYVVTESGVEGPKED